MLQPGLLAFVPMIKPISLAFLFPVLCASAAPSLLADGDYFAAISEDTRMALDVLPQHPDAEGTSSASIAIQQFVFMSDQVDKMYALVMSPIRQSLHAGDSLHYPTFGPQMWKLVGHKIKHVRSGLYLCAAAGEDQGAADEPDAVPLALCAEEDALDFVYDLAGYRWFTRDMRLVLDTAGSKAAGSAVVLRETDRLHAPNQMWRNVRISVDEPEPDHPKDAEMGSSSGRAVPLAQGSRLVAYTVYGILGLSGCAFVVALIYVLVKRARQPRAIYYSPLASEDEVLID